MTDDILDPSANVPALDEAELANALAPLTADRDDFRAGVEAKIAADGSERTANPPTPSWLRRAASIAPPGLADVALASPGGSAKATAAMWLVTPWAMLALGFFAFVGMLAATLRLTSSRTDADAPIRGGVPGLRTWSAIAVFPAGIAVASLLWRDASWLFATFLLGGLAVVMAVRSLSRAGLADRQRIGSLALGGLFALSILAFLIVTGHRDATSPWTLAMLPLIAATTIAIGTLSKNGSQAKILCVAAAVYAFLSWDRLNLDPMSREDLVQWCEQFDDDTANRGGWEALGYARRALGEPAPDLTRAAEQLVAFSPWNDEVKWHIGAAAWRAGLTTPELLAEFQLSDEQWDELRDEKRLLYGLEAIGFAAANSMGTPDDAHLKIAWRAVERTMQHAKNVHSIRFALASVEAAAALGDHSYAERHRDAIHEILTASFTHTGRERGGFGEWLGAKHDNLFTMFAYTRNGVTLMSYVGAPPSLDLHELDRYLTRNLSRKPGKAGLSLAMTRVHLRSFCDVTPKDPAFLVFARENLAFLLVALFCGLGLWVVVRAPKPIPIEIGPMAANP